MSQLHKEKKSISKKKKKKNLTVFISLDPTTSAYVKQAQTTTDRRQWKT